MGLIGLVAAEEMVCMASADHGPQESDKIGPDDVKSVDIELEQSAKAEVASDAIAHGSPNEPGYSLHVTNAAYVPPARLRTSIPNIELPADLQMPTLDIEMASAPEVTAVRAAFKAAANRASAPQAPIERADDAVSDAPPDPNLPPTEIVTKHVRLTANVLSPTPAQINAQKPPPLILPPRKAPAAKTPPAKPAAAAPEAKVSSEQETVAISKGSFEQETVAMPKVLPPAQSDSPAELLDPLPDFGQDPEAHASFYRRHPTRAVAAGVVAVLVVGLWLGRSRLSAWLSPPPPPPAVAAAITPQERVKEALESGDTAYAEEDYQAAISNYEAALADEPNSGPAHRALGLAYQAIHEDAKALPHLEAYLALNPHAQDSANVTKLIVSLRKTSHAAGASNVGEAGAKSGHHQRHLKTKAQTR